MIYELESDEDFDYEGDSEDVSEDEIVIVVSRGRSDQPHRSLEAMCFSITFLELKITPSMRISMDGSSGYGMGLPISIYRFVARSPDERRFWKRDFEDC
ncbi:hypothetical protein HPB47_010047 [Ixodes persulcatus]|uniref:Uncharacterized protein n=1 Tax=Ixodes persulcatus TaxID=34615 RepID=A0AC60P061_IXOPE|nr:hypothetical protein HPB47_010047 [Ixodes persulcatus]